MALYKGQGISGGVNWGKVSSQMGGTRSSQQCKKRWCYTLKEADSGLIKEGAWAEDEVRLTNPAIGHCLYCLCNILIALCNNVHIFYTASVLYACIIYMIANVTML
jgi:hypothetical protein